MNKQLISLICLLGIVAAASYYLFSQSAEDSVDKTRLFPNLAEHAASVERIKISTANGTLLDAVPASNGWLTSLEGIDVNYPVDQDHLTGLIEGLSKAELFERKTTRPENYSKLNLSDVWNPDSLTTLVKVSTSDENLMVLIGSQASSGQGSYARLVGDEQSWLLNQTIPLPTDAFDWLQQPILDVEVKQISSITRLGPDGFTIVASKVDGTSFELANLQPEQSLKYASIVDGFVESLVNLSFDKILTATEANWPVGSEFIIFEIALDDGSALQMQLLNTEPMAWVKLEQTGEGARPYWHGLTYQISNFSAGQLDKQLTDFLEADTEAPIQQSTSPGVSIDEGESPSGF